MRAGEFRVRRGMLAMVSAVVAAAAGIGFVSTTAFAATQGPPVPVFKQCTGTATDQSAEAGHTVTCTVTATLPNGTGGTYAVQLTGPTNAATQTCAGVAATTTFTGPANNICTWTVTASPGITPGTMIGTETIFIAPLTPAGSSVTQSGELCGAPIPVIAPAPQCPPTGFQPILTTGPGACVGSANGCTGLPGLPGGGTPTPTPTPSGNGNGNGNGNGTGGTTTGTTTTTGTGQVKAASTPFTGGPEHPFPVAATGIAVGGSLLMLAAVAAPMWVRRRREPHSSDS